MARIFFKQDYYEYPKIQYSYSINLPLYDNYIGFDFDKKDYYTYSSITTRKNDDIPNDDYIFKKARDFLLKKIYDEPEPYYILELQNDSEFENYFVEKVLEAVKNFLSQYNYTIKELLYKKSYSFEINDIMIFSICFTCDNYIKASFSSNDKGSGYGFNIGIDSNYNYYSAITLPNYFIEELELSNGHLPRLIEAIIKIIAMDFL